MVVWVDYHDPVKGKGSELREAVGDILKNITKAQELFNFTHLK